MSPEYDFNLRYRVDLVNNKQAQEIAATLRKVPGLEVVEVSLTGELNDPKANLAGEKPEQTKEPQNSL